MFTSLSKLKVPYTLNFMLAMTLQLIPVFQREVGIIMSAQKSRGMKGKGFSAVLPSFVPVFVGAIERVQQLSISLESRGFGSNGIKTSYRQVRGRPSDWVIGILGALGVLMRRNPLIIFMSIELMLNSVNLTLIAFSSQLGNVTGQMLVFFVMTVAAAEAVIGLAIVIAAFRHRQTLDPQEMQLLKW